MAKCEACLTAEGTYHVTLGVTVVGPKRDKKKLVQFWLCEGCERSLSQVMEGGPAQRQRVARRMTEFPEYLSHWKDWRDRRWGTGKAGEAQA
jgi:hypothetical protein